MRKICWCLRRSIRAFFFVFVRLSTWSSASKRFSVSAAVPLSSAVFPLSGHSDGHVVHVSPSSPPPPLLPIGRRQPQPPSDQLHGVAAPAGDSSRSSSAESVDTAVRQAEEEADSEGDKSAAASASATAAATASASAAQADQSHDGDSSISIATPGQGSEVSASESEAAAAAAAPAAVDVDDDDAASDGDESVDATDREMDQRILAHGSIFVDSIECNKSMGQVKEAGEQEVRRKCRAVHWHPSLPVAQREVIVGAVRLPFDGVPVREHAAWRPMGQCTRKNNRLRKERRRDCGGARQMCGARDSLRSALLSVHRCPPLLSVAFAAVAAHDDDNDTVPVEEEEGDEPPPQQQQPMQQILAVTEDEWDEWSMDVDQ